MGDQSLPSGACQRFLMGRQFLPKNAGKQTQERGLEAKQLLLACNDTSFICPNEPDLLWDGCLLHTVATVPSTARACGRKRHKATLSDVCRKTFILEHETAVLPAQLDIMMTSATARDERHGDEQSKLIEHVLPEQQIKE